MMPHCRCRHALPLAAAALFLAAHTVWAAGGQAADPMQRLIAMALHLPALLLGIGLHEFAHAYVAVRCGDLTPEDEGRLSLNPLDHLEPIGSLLILTALYTGWPLIGWGLPVPVRAAAFRNPIRDMMKVGIAGPMMNLAVAGVSAIVYAGFASLGYDSPLGLPPEAVSRVHTLLFGIVVTNLSLAVFNLLPVPPLDGHWIAREFMNADQTVLMAQIEPYGFLILLILMQTPLLNAPFRMVGLFASSLVDSWAWIAGFLAAVGVAWWLLLRSLPWFSLRRGE